MALGFCENRFSDARERLAIDPQRHNFGRGAACLSYRRQGGYSAPGEAWASPTHPQVPFPLSLLLSHPEPIEGYVELIMVFGYNFNCVTSI